MRIDAYASICIWQGKPAELARRPWSHLVTPIGLQRWHGFIKSRDHHALRDLLHPDVVFESPVVHTPQRGRDIAIKYLTGATKVLGGPSFNYVGEWTGEAGVVLEFACEVDSVTINGVDIITFDADDRIAHFKVMVRPLKAINLCIV
jgi:hypothetical protein